MELFNFEDLDQKHRDLNMRNLNFYYKMVGTVLSIFMVKFVLKYNYSDYLPMFIILYSLFLISYPLAKYIFKNTFVALWTFFFTIIIILDILMFMSGGIRAPGNIWFSLFPFFGASLLGKRGFLWGILLVTLTFLVLLFLNYMNIEMYPFKNAESFQFEFRVNLIIFTFTSFYYTYIFVSAEKEYQEHLKAEKEKNDNLLRILFHDLANPMQTIRLLIKKAQMNRNVEEFPKIIVQLDKTSNRIVEILDHVRQMKAIEDNKISYEIRPVNLYENAHVLKELFIDKLEEKNLDFIILNSSNDQTEVNVDPIYFLNQVLANLMSNAIKFSEPGKKITIGWENIDQQTVISFSDQGIGIPTEHLKNLFDQKKQNSRRGTAGEMGTGYGMALVKSFINHFNGSIFVESKEMSENNLNSGTVFKIYLPKVTEESTKKSTYPVHA